MNSISLTYSGAQIKAKCANPSVNSIETILLETGLLGVPVGTSVMLESVILQGVNLGASYYVNVDLLQGVGASSFFNYTWGNTSPPAGAGSNTILAGAPLTDGKLYAKVQIFDVGKVLTDIPNGAWITFILTLSLPGNAPGSDTATDLATLSSSVSTLTPKVGKLVSGTTVKNSSFPILKSATVASGVAVFHLTSDGLVPSVTNTALFPTGPELDSVMLNVNDATASYQYGWAWTNSNKTLTATVNKLSTANIVTGVLGQVQANGAVCKLRVDGN